MKIRGVFVAGLTVALPLLLRAQQDPQFTQFYFNKLMINPATAGYHDNICVNLFNRYQWTGFERAPLTNQLSVDANLKTFVKSDIGVGLTVFNDNIGFFNTTGLRAAGAYRFPLGPGRLGVGIDLGFQNMIVNGAQWVGPQTSNPQLDPSLPLSGSSMVFDAGAGVFYHTPRWYAGISAKQLPGMKFKNFSYRAARHMFFMGGYTFKGIGGNPNIDLNPNAIVKTDLATVSFDVNVNLIFKERYWGGLTYRFQDAVALNLGMIIWQTDQHAFTAGYSYDLTTSRLLRFSYGTHELFLRYCFKLALPPMGGGFRVRDLDSKRDW